MMTASMPARARGGEICAAIGAATRAASVSSAGGGVPATEISAATSSNASGEPKDPPPFPTDTDDNLRPR